jgi:hypothetical protein
VHSVVTKTVMSNPVIAAELARTVLRSGAEPLIDRTQAAG